jgi:4-alpha-glucanotransferase
MNSWIDRRRSAVLLHITSLPGPFHKGVLGNEARRFIEDMASGGFSVWQFLPLGPTHEHGSPYESLSSFAGNPELLDLRECVNQGWLDKPSLSGCDSARTHAALRHKAGINFWKDVSQSAQLSGKIDAFRLENKYWLDDFALFSALKIARRNQAWWQWETPLRDRRPQALAAAQRDYAPHIQQVVFEQFLFNHQWQVLKSFAESHRVRLFGDLPIYVAHDSSDVWAKQQYFTLNELGLCEEVAGVPPDYFSATGQRWGNPLYRWDAMAAEGFDWWVRRVRRQLDFMHMMRIDHFRGLESFWAIPGKSKDGIAGEWRKAPGEALLQTLKQRLGKFSLIAEDLGIITEEVTALRDKFDLPGMKILQFAFNGDADNPHLPGNIGENAVAYVGAHDNDTSLGWFKSADESVRNRALRILGAQAQDMPWPLIEAALASAARLAVIPMQDLLELGPETRFNKPGTLENNWLWRMQRLPEPGASCWQRARLLNRKHRRI